MATVPLLRYTTPCSKFLVDKDGNVVGRWVEACGRGSVG